MNEKVRKDQSMEIEDSKERYALLGQDSAMEDINNSATIPDESAEVVVKVGSKRAYNEIEDLNSPLSEDDSKNKQIVAASDMEKSTMVSDSKASSSAHQENNWLESAKAELGEVREENERLKKYISKMMKDYEALQMQFYQVTKQEETMKSTQETEETETPEELVSLSLGRFSSTTESKKDGKNKSNNFTQIVMKEDEDEQCNERELSLALECKAESVANRSRVNSIEEVKEEAGETCQSKKPLQNGKDEVVQQNPLKKARVCVRARCDTPTMNDGCQWRKYGQKIAKGNPCPRAYYRCTVAASCPVRKQVQRCAEDMSVLITTYEGTHNHPLPLSATTMASTTSAAAAMLLSGSSSSTSRATGLNPSALIRTTPADLHNLNFHLSDNSNPKNFYLQNPSISPSPSHPTITLDLTNPSPNSSNYTRFSSSYSVPKYAPSTLNFSSSPTELNWGNGFFNYGITNSTSRAINTGRSQIESNIFQSYMHNKKTPIVAHQQDNSSIAAATKAITADPSFQSALAAALSSIIGSSGGGDGSKGKWGEQFLEASGGYCPPGLSKGNACATSYLNKSMVDLQSGSLMLLPTSLPIASPKSNASSSPGDSKDHNS